MVGSGKKLYRGPKDRERVCVLGEEATSSTEGRTSPHQPAKGHPSGVWGAASAQIEFAAF